MKKFRAIIALAIFTLLLFSNIIASAAIYTTTTTHYYSCRAHTDCHYISFTSQGNTITGEIYDKYFADSNSHWPNAFRYDRVWSYQIGATGYAKGTYTIYSSLITQWASLAFSSTSDTIVHTY